MKALISEKLISKLEAAEKPYEVRDIRLPGFLLRVQPCRWYHLDGSPCQARKQCTLDHRPPVASMSYVAQYGRGKRITIGPTTKLKAEKAREEAGLRIADAVRGLDPMAERRKARSHTFEQFIEEEYKPYLFTPHFRESHAKEAMRVARSYFPVIGDKKLSEIDAWMIEKYRSARLKAGVSAPTTNRELSVVKAALSVAVEKGFLKSNPIAKVKQFQEDDEGRVRYLSEDEDSRLRIALDGREAKMRHERENFNAWRRERGYILFPEFGSFVDHLKPITLVALNTGMRRGELFNLKREHIDFVKRFLTISWRTAKGKKTRHIPLNDECFDVLTKWRQQANSEDFVFCGRNGKRMGSIKTAWAHLMRDAKIKDFHFHDCRHDFASKLVMRGEDLNTVRELLGHSDIKMTLRYAHLAPEKLAAAVAKLGAK